METTIYLVQIETATGDYAPLCSFISEDGAISFIKERRFEAPHDTLRVEPITFYNI